MKRQTSRGDVQKEAVKEKQKKTSHGRLTDRKEDDHGSLAASEDSASSSGNGKQARRAEIENEMSANEDTSVNETESRGELEPNDNRADSITGHLAESSDATQKQTDSNCETQNAEETGSEQRQRSSGESHGATAADADNMAASNTPGHLTGETPVLNRGYESDFS